MAAFCQAIQSWPASLVKTAVWMYGPKRAVRAVLQSPRQVAAVRIHLATLGFSLAVQSKQFQQLQLPKDRRSTQSFQCLMKCQKPKVLLKRLQHGLMGFYRLVMTTTPAQLGKKYLFPLAGRLSIARVKQPFGADQARMRASAPPPTSMAMTNCLSFPPALFLILKPVIQSLQPLPT